MLKFLNQSYQWIVSGFGVLVLGWLVQNWFKKPSPTTDIAAPAAGTHPTAKEIGEQRCVILPASWRTRLINVGKTETENYKVVLIVSDHPVTIYCHVNVKDYPRLRVAKEGTPIEVSGFVESVAAGGYEITLRDVVKLVFLD